MILVTGANGFVGGALCRSARGRGMAVRGAVRQAPAAGDVAVGDIDGNTDWSAALDGCDTVIHAAARVHVMADTSVDPMAAYRQVNVDGSLALARQARKAGVRRFVYVSSIKVNGERTTGTAFTSADRAAAVDPYGQSKWEAEQALAALSKINGIELVVVRPPLVYGPGVKANFLQLIRLVERGVPLPLGAIDNRRSMVALDNLVDLLLCCCAHPQAPGETLLVSDDDDLSTARLIGMIAQSFGRAARMLPVPAWALRAGAGMLGKSAMASRLLDSLQVDISSTKRTLQWTPPVQTQDAIRATVLHYLQTQSGKSV